MKKLFFFSSEMRYVSSKIAQNILTQSWEKDSTVQLNFSYSMKQKVLATHYMKNTIIIKCFRVNYSERQDCQ